MRATSAERSSGSFASGPQVRATTPAWSGHRRASGIRGAVSWHRESRPTTPGAQSYSGCAQPDPDFLYKLTVLAYSTPVPPGIPDRDIGAKAIPGTGPYRFRTVNARGLRFERNPFFREWSRAAQPAGNPDAIVWRYAPSRRSAVNEVERGRADWLLGRIPPAELRSLQLRYPSRVQVNPTPTVDFIHLNTHRRPFDDVRVRRALNFAVDRAKIAGWYGGPLVATPLCQPLAPGLLGYRRYCPYTRDPRSDGRWSRPDLARAKRLVAASGTPGERVDVWGSSDDLVPPQVLGTSRRC